MLIFVIFNEIVVLMLVLLIFDVLCKISGIEMVLCMCLMILKFNCGFDV